MKNDINDELILAIRILLATLFLIFGWRKLRDYSGMVSQMVQLGAPMPMLAAAVAIFMELSVAFAVVVADQVASMNGFTKISALWEALLTGAGKIFDRCIAQYRRAIGCVLLGRRCNVT